MLNKKITLLLIILFSMFCMQTCSNTRKSDRRSANNDEISEDQLKFSGINSMLREKAQKDISFLLLASEKEHSCRITPDLPNGLSLKGCVIEGNVDKPIASATYQVKVFDSNETNVHNFDLTIEILLPTLDSQNFRMFLDTPEIINVLPSEFKNLNCDVVPELPETFEIVKEKGCQIQGYSRTYLEHNDYQMIIKSKDGFMGYFNFGLEVVSPFPELTGNNEIFMCLNPIDKLEIVFENIGNDIENCRVEPPLPGGLSIGKNDCKIEGIPKEIYDVNKFKIIASSEIGYSNKNITLAISKCDRPKLHSIHKENRLYFYKDFDKVDYKFSNLSSAEIDKCIISPMLPNGISIESKTCKIYGKPQNTNLVEKYIVKAFSKNGKFDEYNIELVVKDAFVSKWNADVEVDGKFLMKLGKHPNGEYNFLVDWGDGNISYVNDNIDEDFYHYYENSGIYELKIIGVFKGILGGTKITEISNFGSLRLVDSSKFIVDGENIYLGAFENSKNLILTASDELDLYNVKSIRNLFKNASNIDSEIKMDTSEVSDISSLFEGASNFDQPVLYDTSKVRYMSGVFKDAASFNQLVEFDTSNALDLSEMFMNATNFSQAVSFDTSNVTRISGMFEGAYSFDQAIHFDGLNIVDVSRLFKDAKIFSSDVHFMSNNIKLMRSVFDGAVLYNKKINWNTSNVIDMGFLFANTKKYNSEIEFETGNVKYFDGMFSNAEAFNKSVEINTENAVDMNQMFDGALLFNSEIEFNSHQVVNMEKMFANTPVFDSEVKLKTLNVRNMSGMFLMAKKFNKPIELDSSSLVDVSHMFEGAEKFNQKVILNGNKILNSTNIFKDAISYNNVFELDFENIRFSNWMFDGAVSYTVDTMDDFLIELSKKPLVPAYSYIPELELAPNGRSSRSDEAVGVLKSKGWYISE